MRTVHAPMLVIAILAAHAAGQEAAPEPADWVRDRAIAVDTVEAEHGLADLEPLRNLIGDARIVALGECTHGSREVFQMKHRLLEFLATEMGFTIFSIEASMPEAYRLNDYVRGGDGDPKALIAGMYFWTWNTAEVLDMVEWMRRFNAAGRGPVQFTGFDMQTPDVAMRIARDFVVEVDPDYLPELERRYEQARRAEPAGPRGGAGICTGQFPIEVARGKRVRFRGFIRTENLQNGWAGLWWRIDGPRGPLGFDNMNDRGPRGTSDWAEYAIELEVPKEAININFGLIMSGQGRAWFDGLTIQLDDIPYENPDLFDLDFEGPRIRGIMPMVPAFPATLDREVVCSGEQSLRLESAAAPEPAGDPGAASRAAREVYEHLATNARRYREIADGERVDWAIQNARVVMQGLQMRAGGGGILRDRSMAENIAWILEQNPGAKIVLWAHNGHVARMPGAMGSHLHRRFGDDMVVVGFATGEGEYYAVGENGLGVHPLLPPPEDSVEAVLRASGLPRLILDVGGEDGVDPGRAWLEERRPFRSIGALAMPDRQFFPVEVPALYDLIIYIDRTSASIPLAP